MNTSPFDYDPADEKVIAKVLATKGADLSLLEVNNDGRFTAHVRLRPYTLRTMCLLVCLDRLTMDDLRDDEQVDSILYRASEVESLLNEDRQNPLALSVAKEAEALAFDAEDALRDAIDREVTVMVSDVLSWCPEALSEAFSFHVLYPALMKAETRQDVERITGHPAANAAIQHIAENLLGLRTPEVAA